MYLNFVPEMKQGMRSSLPGAQEEREAEGGGGV